MNAIAKVGPVSAMPQVHEIKSEAGALMDVIARAASDPNTDVEKLERLMGLYERITDRTAKGAFDAALAEMQPNLPVINERGAISTDKGRTVQSTFAKWEDINEAIGPVLAAHGFGLSFKTGLSDDGRILVTAILSHREGHREETTLTLPHDSSGSKNAVQAVGSSTSYGKRYTAMALLNITSRAPQDRDDDGQRGGAGPTITPDQADELQAIIDSVSADKPRFLRYMKVEKLGDLPAARFNDALIALNKKAGR